MKILGAILIYVSVAAFVTALEYHEHSFLKALVNALCTATIMAMFVAGIGLLVG